MSGKETKSTEPESIGPESTEPESRETGGGRVGGEKIGGGVGGEKIGGGVGGGSAGGVARRRVEVIYLHTAADARSLATSRVGAKLVEGAEVEARGARVANRSSDGDTSAAEIDAWHRQQGWKKAGYHFVVRKTGAVESAAAGFTLRRLDEVGAGVAGDNRRSIHVCVSGHGDVEPWTPAQHAAVVALCASLCRDYGLCADAVLGHREVNERVRRGEVNARYRTAKSCPGTLVAMEAVRAAVRAALG